MQILQDWGLCLPLLPQSYLNNIFKVIGQHCCRLAVCAGRRAVLWRMCLPGEQDVTLLVNEAGCLAGCSMACNPDLPLGSTAPVGFSCALLDGAAAMCTGEAAEVRRHLIAIRKLSALMGVRELVLSLALGSLGCCCGSLQALLGSPERFWSGYTAAQDGLAEHRWFKHIAFSRRKAP